MIRLTELALPLDHPAEALPQAVARRLGVAEAELQNLTVFKRSYDARKKNTEIKFIYIIDVSLANEADVLERLADDRHIRPKIPGRCGAITCLPLNLTCSLVKAVRACSPTVSSIAKLKTLSFTAEK